MAWKPLPKHIEYAFDRQIEGYHAAIKKLPLPKDADPEYIKGYQAKMQGQLLDTRVLQYMMRG